MARNKQAVEAYKIENVCLYNEQGSIALRNLHGSISEKVSNTSFETQLVLPDADISKLTRGRNYYAVGLKEDKLPFRSELVKLTDSNGNVANFRGEIVSPKGPFGKNEAYGVSPEATISIDYTNFSKKTFNRGRWGARLQKVFGELTNAPAITLDANSGQQSIGAYQQLAKLAEGPMDIILCWFTNDDEWSGFGVWIHFYFQMFTGGPSPIWHVTSNDGYEWSPSGKDPSYPYTWPADIGYNVKATATAGKHSLHVSVIVQD